MKTADYRESIRAAVFTRDGGLCVFCGKEAKDAHHLLERRLWTPDDGYLMDNLISVCEGCHIQCELTNISVEEGRKAAGITRIEVPKHMYWDQSYDKWGNPVLADGRRLQGELMDDKLRQFLSHVDFAKYIKYPRTPHLSWSHPNPDDIVIKHLDIDQDEEIIVTEKMDGECTTMYDDHIHARSVDGKSHIGQSWVKNFWSKNIAHVISETMRICGENVYAQHSIYYEGLSTYFYGFSIWDGMTCLSWDETEEWFELLGVTPVPLLYRGPLKDFVSPNLDEQKQEGFVIRPSRRLSYREFPRVVGKYVREGHLQTRDRWKMEIRPNSMTAQSTMDNMSSGH